jgi:hypothetical protein
MLRRIAITVALGLVSAGLAAGAALAGPLPTPPTPDEVTEVSWAIPKGQCPLLPRNVRVTGTGTAWKYTTSVTDPTTGATSYTELNVIKGTARDNRGGRYTFDYHNVLTAADARAPFSGIMSDHFTLKGRGVANGLHSAWLANFTLISEDPFNATIDPIWHVGRPIDFKTGAPLCDPL